MHLPCRHAEFCDSCSQQLEHCPLCRSPIQERKVRLQHMPPTSCLILQPVDAAAAAAANDDHAAAADDDDDDDDDADDADDNE